MRWTCCWLWIICACFASVAQAADGLLNIYWIDVEGGAATLIVSPAGESILIDSGNPGRRDPDRIVKMAATAGLRQIDHLITTHYHTDHFGGAAALSQLLPIKSVYDNGNFEGQREKPAKEYLEFAAERRVVLSAGDEMSLKQTATPFSMRCLCARQKIIAAPSGSLAENPNCAAAVAKPIDNSDNANSIVMLLSFGDFRFFDAGDLTWNVEKLLVCPVNLVGKIDVYQTTHHGLDASNNPVLVNTLAPTVAIFNNGVTKGCSPEAFSTLKALASVQSIYQMHRNQRPDGETINTAPEQIANPDKDCPASYIHLSVEASGKSYTVHVPSTNHKRTFQTK